VITLEDEGDLIACIDDCVNGANALEEAIEDFATEEYERIAHGVKKMGEFLEHVGDAMIDCQNASIADDISHLS